MGAGQSIPSKLTREKVFELTRDTRSTMDVLLEYMLKEITVRDFLALSNPLECKKYVIFMANTLHKYFYELQIEPIKDKKGVIAFRSVKDLVNPHEGGDEERQSLCLTLAFFYTRIFQIYGALALTLIDDAKYMTESGIIPISYRDSDTVKRGLLPPGYKTYTAYGGDKISYNDLLNFYFLNAYLYDTKGGQRGYQTIYTGRSNESKGTIYFRAEKRVGNENVIFGRNESSVLAPQKGVFTIEYQGAKRDAYLIVIAESIGKGRIIFTFDSLKYYKAGRSELLSTKVPLEIIPLSKFLIYSSQPGGPESPKVFSIEGQAAGKERGITEYFNDIFNKLVPYIKKLVESDIKPTDRAGTVLSELGTTEELRLARIIQNLTKTKPLGHCLARALQLLKTMPFKDEPAISHICKARFLEQVVNSAAGTKTIVSRSGIPKPGDALDASPGLAALSQLFYDTIAAGTPKLIISDKPRADEKQSSMQQYITFMKNMAKLFGDTFVASSDTVRIGLKGIKNKRDDEICKNPSDSKQKITGDIVIPTNKVKSVYEIVNQLYRTQLEHAASCGKIFKMLFNIQRDKSSGRFRVSLSETVIKKGFPEIDRINYEARKTLVNYYTNCELKYLEGVKIVLGSAFPSTASATATAPATATATTTVVK